MQKFGFRLYETEFLVKQDIPNHLPFGIRQFLPVHILLVLINTITEAFVSLAFVRLM